MGTRKRSRKIKSGNKRLKKLTKLFIIANKCAMASVTAFYKAQITAIMCKKAASEFATGGMVARQGKGEIILPVDSGPQYEYHLGPNFKKEQTKTDDVNLYNNNVVNITVEELSDEETIKELSETLEPFIRKDSKNVTSRT